MRITTLARVAQEIAGHDSDHMITRGLRDLVLQSANGGDRRFIRYVVADLLRYLSSSPRRVAGETLVRADLAARWLARAQDATPDGGLSYGYFPFKVAGGWRPSYPETTGYTIPTLLEYARVTERSEYRERALRMATFVARCQMKSGALYGGVVRADGDGVAVAFNTGMALMGMLAAYRDTGSPLYGDSARRAAEFLLHDVGEDGHFQSHGPKVAAHTIKTYTCLCAWPLFEAGREFEDDRYCDAALRVGRAVLELQRSNGWFEENCLSNRRDVPLLHTIGYTLQGLLELGISAGDGTFIDAARRGLIGLLSYCDRGFLHARWFADWQPAALSSCLTGAAQVSVVCYRLAEHTGEVRYLRAGDGVLDYLKGLQLTDSARSDLPQIVGALGGSFPLVGAYMPNGYPGWATKFFLDALLCQHAVALPAAAAHQSSESLARARA